MRIGLLAHDFLSWQGGADFLDLVARSLLATPSRHQLILLVPLRGPRIWARSLRLAARRWLSQKDISWNWHPPSNDYFQSELASLPPVVQRVWLDIGRRSLEKAVARQGLDVVLPSVHTLGRSFVIPWLGYAYDFQHRYFPEFFSEKDRLSRDDHFRAIFNDPPVTIVNSHAVAQDARRFVQPLQSRIHALPFTPLLREEWNVSCSNLWHQYKLDPSIPFFLISNQFWPHKNHEVVFRASALLKQQGLRFQVVCTGAFDTAETRPVAGRLSRDFKELLCNGTIVLLGWIPKLDQIGLLRLATAIIQPSRFEGGPGGGISYHAVALGQPLLLSDLPVNREVIGDNVIFFPPENPQDLARLMRRWLSRPPAISEPWTLLQKRSVAAACACGNVLEEAIHEAVALSRNSDPAPLGSC